MGLGDDRHDCYTEQIDRTEFRPPLLILVKTVAAVDPRRHSFNVIDRQQRIHPASSLLLLCANDTGIVHGSGTLDIKLAICQAFITFKQGSDIILWSVMILRASYSL